MNPSDHKIAEKFKENLLENRIPVRELIVFGSRARGDAGPDSDLDVLLIVDENNSDIREKVSNCAWEVGFEENILIQYILMTYQQARVGPEKSSLFMQAVEQEGIAV